MKYPCGIIRDLLPLYIDDVCNAESKTVVENHLPECEKCRQYYESMTSIDGFTEKQNDNSEDMKMADSLKKIKGKINRKTRNIIIGAAAAILAVAVSSYVLFSVPLREIDLSDISVSAEVYPISGLPSELIVDKDSVHISIGEADTSNTYKIDIPAMPNANISVSEGVMERNGYVTVISWSSPYIMQVAALSENSYQNTDTLYVNSFKTTVLGSKASNYTTKQLEFKEINKIVFVDDNGRETVLWSR